MICASVEHPVDYQTTARLATEAFNSPDVVFRPEQMKWFYEECFSRQTTVVALRDGNIKVGQIAMVHQPIMIDGVERLATQLVDIFIVKEYRSRQSLTLMFEEARRQCALLNCRAALGMPNKTAMPVNAHFFKLMPFLWLQIRAGLSFRSPQPAALVFSGRFAEMTPASATRLFSRYAAAQRGNGLNWDGEMLLRRLSGHKQTYGIHASGNLLMISSPRMSRGIPYTLLCGFFARPGVTVPADDTRQLVRAACRLWRNPLYMFAGRNEAVPALPGLPLPRWLRPSLMLLQLRDFDAQAPALHLDRYQLLDFDFA